MPEDDMTVVPPKRMTVTRLGHKVDEVHESVDEISNELAEIKQVLKSLLEVTLGLNTKEEEEKPPNKEDYSMYG
tara:strand:+ start:63 stop:284 length:222 start_codon:yes stop_codon:yes gene_type:complete